MRAKLILIGGILPVAIAAITTVVMLTWIGDLPDPIAVHWSGSSPDGFGSPLAFVFVPLIITTFFAVFVVASVLGALASQNVSRVQKFLVVTSLGLGVLLSVGMGVSVAIQRGLADATSAPSPVLGLLSGLVLGVALAAVAWFLLPKAEAISHEGEEVSPMPKAKGEKLVWSRSVSISPFVLAVVGAAVVLVMAVSVLTLVVGNDSVWTALWSLGLVVVVGSAASYWRVTADRHGLSVRSHLGWPRVRIWADDIARVRVIEVNATGEFGGWGYRWAGKGRTGIILRDGDAIEITKKNGKSFVVTVDDARTGARVLAAIIARPSGDSR